MQKPVITDDDMAAAFIVHLVCGIGALAAVAAVLYGISALIT
ncbi:hypothetical protein [Runella sp.]